MRPKADQSLPNFPFFSPSLQTPTKTNNTTPAPLANYTVMDLEWVITINSSLPDIIVTGTIQDVVAHLGNIYPSYVATLKEIISNKKTRDYREEGATKQGATISSRQTATDYYCSIFRDAQYDDIQAGISYLNRLNGRPSMGPGPGTCGRVSCKYRLTNGSNSSLLCGCPTFSLSLFFYLVTKVSTLTVPNSMSHGQPIMPGYVYMYMYT